MEHNKPNWDKLQAISVLTSDSPQLGPALKKNPSTCMVIYGLHAWSYLIYRVSTPNICLQLVVYNNYQENLADAKNCL